MELKEYQKIIKKAKSKDELQQISYKALRDDKECTVFSKKYNKIVNMCIKREMELS